MSAPGFEHHTPDKAQEADSHTKRYNLAKATPDVEVLHVTQKACNASVACNMLFLAGDRPICCPFTLNYMLCHHNMEWVRSLVFSAQILIIAYREGFHPAPFSSAHHGPDR
jgi:hypothetical protein